jgi:hypothetical protein
LRYGKPLIAEDKSQARLLFGNASSVTCAEPENVETVTHHHESTSGEVVRLPVLVREYHPLVKNSDINAVHSVFGIVRFPCKQISSQLSSA